jgi:hypothetical protein
VTLFAAADRKNLIAPPETFEAATYGGTAYARNVVRTALALEFTAQLAQLDTPFNYRGGTPLQAGLGWPPPRASNDNDYDTTDAPALLTAVEKVAATFAASGATIRTVATKMPGFKRDVSFPRVNPPLVLRVDAIPLRAFPTAHGPLTLPKPWKGVSIPNATTYPAHAASKLLLSAAPPFGRTVDPPQAYGGRKSRIKDLFDLSCLGHLDLAGAEVTASVADEMARKNQYLGRAYKQGTVVNQAMAGLRFFAAPRPKNEEEGAPQWRAYSQIRQTIRDPFTEADLRIAAGCAHFALHSLAKTSLNWKDAWRPFVDRRPRKTGSGALPAGIAFSPTDQAIAGLVEAWRT